LSDISKCSTEDMNKFTVIPNFTFLAPTIYYIIHGQKNKKKLMQ
jgi:hypothetical protein